VILKFVSYLRQREGIELVLNRVVSLLLPFLVIPVVLKNSGVQTYGLYILICGFASVISFTDFGISNVLVREISLDLKLSDGRGISKIVTNAMSILVACALAISSLGLVLAQSINWKNFFRLSLDESHFFKVSVLVAFLSIGISIVGSASEKILLGIGRNRIYSRLILGAKVLSAISLIFASKSTNPLPGLVFAQLGIPGFVGAVSLFLVSKIHPGFVLSLHHLDVASSRRLLKGSLFFLFLQIAATLSYEIDSIFVGHILTPKAVSVLSLSWKAISIPAVISASRFVPLWSLAGTLDEIADAGKLFLLVRRVLEQVLVVILPISLVILIFGKFGIETWTHHLISPKYGLIMAGTLWLILSSVMQPIAYILNGLQLKRFMLISTGSFTLMNIFLSIVITRLWRVPESPLWADSIAAVLCFFVPFGFVVAHWRQSLPDSKI